MPLSYAQSLGNGSQRNFDVPCEYLSKTHISVKVDGVDVPFTWVDTYRLMTSTAPALNAIVEVRRVTPREDRLVTFTDGSTLVETDLNTSTLQSFFLAQEAFDQGAASMSITEDGQYSAQTRRISNLGDPVGAQDAATKSWAESGMSSQLAQASAERGAAQTAKTASEAARDASASERQAAQQARADAQSARDSASGHRLNASNAQAASEAARDISVTKATEASNDRQAAQTARSGAEAARDASQGFRNEAQGFRNEAEEFATASDSTTRLSKAQNLADLPNKSAARSNLGVPAGVPAGMVFFSPRGSVPTGYLACEGGTFTTSIYPELYAYLGNSNVLPDMRDRVPRGGGALAGAPGSTQEDALQDHRHLLAMSLNEGAFTGGAGSVRYSAGSADSSGTASGIAGQRTATETRVKAYIGKFVIKAH